MRPDYYDFRGVINETVYEQYESGRDDQARLRALSEMARRVGTFPAMITDKYRFDEGWRKSVDADTVYIFKKYKLNGGQADTW